MSQVQGLFQQVQDFVQCYHENDSDWEWACRVIGCDPYKDWNDEQWELFNELNDNVQEQKMRTGG